MDGLAPFRDRLLRAAVYCRVSTEEQRAAETIEGQVDFGRRYCELHGIQVVDWYRDDGVTGTIPVGARPAGRRLLEDARRGRFGVVLAYRLDRVARKTIHLLNLYEGLDALGIGLRSMTETFDTTTPAGKFTMTMLASIAALERDTLLERTALGKARKRRQGKWSSGGRPPFGYRVNAQGYLEVEPREAEVVRTIFQLYAEDRLSTLAIAGYLAARGVPVASALRGGRRSQGQWGSGRVSLILSNPVYRGGQPAGAAPRDEDAPPVPALVSPELWRVAEAVRGQNRRDARRNGARTYLLRGLVRCGHCGRAYAGDSARDHHYAYYRCAGSRNRSRNHGEPCGAVPMGADELEALVWADIRAFIADPGPLLERLQARLKDELAHQPHVEDELAALELDIRRKAEERRRLINLYRRGLIEEAEVEAELRTLEGETMTLQRRRQALAARRDRRGDFEAQAVTVRLLLERLKDRVDGASPETRRDLVRTLVERVTVETLEENGHKLPKVTVRYRFGGGSSDCDSSLLRVEGQSDAWWDHAGGPPRLRQGPPFRCGASLASGWSSSQAPRKPTSSAAP